MEMIKTSEINFNLVITLMVISNDEVLLNVFQQKYSTDIGLFITQAKNSNLNKTIVSDIKYIFDNIILKRKEYVEVYTELATTIDVVGSAKVVLPKRYGKRQINLDIEKQGGKATDMQLMMLKVNDLKNIVAKLNRRGISSMLGGADTLTDKDCREVVALVKLVQNKLKKIL